MAEATAAAGAREKATPEDLGPERLLAAYRHMVLARAFDERCLALQRQGRIGFYAPLQGQEAAQVGSALALQPEDWIFPAYREIAVALVRGVPLQAIINQFYGNAEDEVKGRQMPNHFGYRRFNFVTASSPVGTQISQAVGTAMAAKYRHEPIVTIAYFGDGTSSSNDFHAGLNFAGVFETPTIFFIQNNQWAISLPRERQTRSATLAEKAQGYGFPGVVVDGMDLAAVYRAVREARERALSGGGPTLIEAQVYRLGPHSTSDDPKRYRTEAELNEWKGRDPIARMKKELLDAGQLDDAQDQAIWESVRDEITKAVKHAEAAGPLPPASIFEDVFQEPTPLLREEQAELERLLSEGVYKP